jgi:hypothetical protein
MCSLTRFTTTAVVNSQESLVFGMFFKTLCILLIWMQTALDLEISHHVARYGSLCLVIISWGPISWDFSPCSEMAAAKRLLRLLRFFFCFFLFFNIDLTLYVEVWYRWARLQPKFPRGCLFPFLFCFHSNYFLYLNLKVYINVCICSDVSLYARMYTCMSLLPL